MSKVIFCYFISFLGIPDKYLPAPDITLLICAIIILLVWFRDKIFSFLKKEREIQKGTVESMWQSYDLLMKTKLLDRKNFEDSNKALEARIKNLNEKLETTEQINQSYLQLIQMLNFCANDIWETAENEAERLAATSSKILLKHLIEASEKTGLSKKRAEEIINLAADGGTPPEDPIEQLFYYLFTLSLNSAFAAEFVQMMASVFPFVMQEFFENPNQDFDKIIKKWLKRKRKHKLYESAVIRFFSKNRKA